MEEVMGIALTVTRVDHTASELRAFAAKSGDGAQVSRFWPLRWFWGGIREPKWPD
jgi:hypothetical protein